MVQFSSVEPEAKAQSCKVLQVPCFGDFGDFLHRHQRVFRLKPDAQGQDLYSCVSWQNIASITL